MYEYQMQTFNTARRALMLPHPSGEAASIASAFHECIRGLENCQLESLDDNAREWVDRLQLLMDSNGVEDPTGIGTSAVKAAALDMEQKTEVAHLVDELANWFARKSRG